MDSFADSKTDFEIFSGLANRLGFESTFTENKNEMEWIKFLWDKSKKIAKDFEINLPDFKKFWEKGFYEVPCPETKKIMFENFRNDPEKFPLKTPSGKIEISSKTIENFKLSDCLSHPSWFEPYEWLGNTNKYPLHLISNQPTHRLHGQLDNASESRNSKIKDREPVLINSSDANQRSIEDDDIVMLYNDRGKVLAGAILSEDVMPGVAVLSTGAWFDPNYILNTEVHGNPNVLTNDVGTSSLGQGPTSHTTLIEIKKASSKEIADVMIFNSLTIKENT